jgi:hypothetical protein
MMNGQSWQVHFRGIGAQKKTLFVSSNQQIPNSLLLTNPMNMLLPSPKKLKTEHDLLARTGITKAGYMLKRTNASPLKPQWRWESWFLILNDHCLAYCGEKHNFSKPDGYLLLTASTRVYQNGEDLVIRIETGYEVLFFKGRDLAEVKEWKKAIHSNVGKLSGLARGQFGVKGKSGDQYFMLHR